MEYRASHRFADMSARKIRPFATLVRGRTLDEALQLLRFEPNKAARLMEQVLLSARGNALDRGARDVEELLVSESRVDDGPMFKRFMPRARGTAYQILRRMAHIHIALEEEQEEMVTEPTVPTPVVTTPTPTEQSPTPPVVTTETIVPPSPTTSNPVSGSTNS
jgi:large subunit ribosomal protein L22